MEQICGRTLRDQLQLRSMFTEHLPSVGAVPAYGGYKDTYKSVCPLGYYSLGREKNVKINTMQSNVYNRGRLT